MYRTLLGDTFFTLLAAESNEVITSFDLEHMKDCMRDISKLTYDQVYEDIQII